MTRVVISQPMYFPWVGFLSQMALADVMIWLDDAQFSRGSFSNRVQVKTPGGVKWMSVPLVDKGHAKLFQDLRSSDPAIADRHASLLKNALGRAPFWGEVEDVFQNAMVSESLLDRLIASAEELAEAVALPARQTYRSSALDVPGRSSARVLDLVKAVGGTSYITGLGARNYLDHQSFEDAGIAVDYMVYAPIPWPQDHGAFTPYVTALDLIAQVPRNDRAGHLNPQTIGWRDFLQTKG